MCQLSHSNGSMTLAISDGRHAKASKYQDAIQGKFLGGRIRAGNSLSATEIGLCSELHVLFFFKSQIAYGDSKFLLQAPFYFQHC